MTNLRRLIPCRHSPECPFKQVIRPVNYRRFQLIECISEGMSEAQLYRFFFDRNFSQWEVKQLLDDCKVEFLAPRL